MPLTFGDRIARAADRIMGLKRGDDRSLARDFDSRSRIRATNHARDSDDSRRVRRWISPEDKAPLKKFSVVVDVDKRRFALLRRIVC
jgi:hypothetical protein